MARHENESSILSRFSGELCGVYSDSEPPQSQLRYVRILDKLDRVIHEQLSSYGIAASSLITEGVCGDELVHNQQTWIWSECSQLQHVNPTFVEGTAPHFCLATEGD